MDESTVHLQTQLPLRSANWMDLGAGMGMGVGAVMGTGQLQKRACSS